MKRWWWVVALLALSVGLNLGLLASVLRDRWVEPGPAEGPPAALRAEPGPAQRLRVAERLGLAGEEAERFAALQGTFLQRTRRARLELEQARRRLKEEISGEAPDPARIEELVRRSAAAHAELERSLAEHVLAARDMLDGEAEERYLLFLSRLGAGPGRGPGSAAPPGRQPPRRPWRRPPAAP